MYTLINKPAATLTPGRIFNRTVSSIPDFNYLVRLSREPDLTRVLVVVHGIARRATFIMRSLGPIADEFNYTLLAPIFNHRSYPDYQRLGREGRGRRADLALLAMLRDARIQIGVSPDIHLFGFSGGAQFVHRFAYAYPGATKSISLAAAGWYTAPAPELSFPYGTKANRKLPDLQFHIDGLAQIPSLVMVGENDNVCDSAVRQSPRLVEQQGEHRLQRAAWFHDQLLEISQAYESSERQFCILPNTAHNFGEAVFCGGLDRRLLEFCETQQTISKFDPSATRGICCKISKGGKTVVVPTLV